ncbi:MAG TPA: M48 family metallopeptidase [Geminicoccaceae bacterium]|nr:M48 family metallopeptidase [Geminicoccaceae bacterium]
MRLRTTIATGLLMAMLAGCQAAPITGRNQLIVLPESQDAQLGLEAYQQILSESSISNDPDLNRRVQEVGRRIAAVSPHPEWDWQFTVIENDEPNAFALPGGKVGVNTGLFQVAKNDAQLAAVIGHEVAHAIARHGAERMSQQVLMQAGLAGLGIATDQTTATLAAQAATLVVTLPYSRTQEAEADHIGLVYMAEAGYDPREAIALWQNFESFGGERPPEFLSTHPAPGSRIQNLQNLLPEVMPIYEANRQKQ